MASRWSVLLVPLLLGTTSLPQGTTAPAPAATIPPIPESLPPTFPRKGVDHVVTYASWRGWGPKGGDRLVRYRQGSRVRSEVTFIGSRRSGEAAHAIAFANLETGASLDLLPDLDGGAAVVTLRRTRDISLPFYRHTLHQTAASERIAGEACRVWVAKPETSGGVTYSACITYDGIPLRETVHYTDGSVMHEAHATRVERREIAAADVLPPRDALDWQRWTAAVSPAPVPIRARPENYALTLVHQAGPRQPEPLLKIYRATGGWESEENRTAASVQSLLIRNASVTFSYLARQATLTIGRRAASQSVQPLDLASAPLPAAPETVAGERCNWFDAAVGVNDYGRRECRTTDALPLIIDEYSRGTQSRHWVATAVSRGQTDGNSLQPPPRLLRWSFWGWPDLDTR